jgi:hypothetical protein
MRAMSTYQELDSIHKVLRLCDPSQQVCLLIHFTERLKAYLTELGLSVSYSPTNFTKQFMCVYYDVQRVHLIVDIYSIITLDGYPLLAPDTAHDSIQGLVDHIEGVGIRYREYVLEQGRKQAIREYCSQCYYCNGAAPYTVGTGQYCGMGWEMEVGCTHRQLLQGDGEQ